MNKKIVIKKVDKIESFGHMTDSELSKLSEEFEPENYNPTENIENMDEVVTIRLTKSEKAKLIEYTKKKGVRRSQFVREAILESINDDSMKQEIHEIYSMLKKHVSSK